MRLLGNRIMISYENTEGEMQTKGGLFVDTSFAKERYSQIQGVCLETNSEEVLPGDEVVFHYLAILNAKNEGSVFVDVDRFGKKSYKAIIPKDLVFFAKRGERIICLNGYVVCKAIPEKNETSLELAKSFVKNQFEVVYDGYEFKKGQVIATRPDCDIPIAANPIIGDTNLLRISRNDIMAIVESGFIRPLCVTE